MCLKLKEGFRVLGAIGIEGTKGGWGAKEKRFLNEYTSSTPTPPPTHPPPPPKKIIIIIIIIIIYIYICI